MCSQSCNALPKPVTDRLVLEKAREERFKSATARAKKFNEDLLKDAARPSSGGIRDTCLMLDLYIGSSRIVNFEVCVVFFSLRKFC
jgi:hypothetical protein